jgi:hypothetical protein
MYFVIMGALIGGGGLGLSLLGLGSVALAVYRHEPFPGVLAALMAGFFALSAWIAWDAAKALQLMPLAVIRVDAAGVRIVRPFMRVFPNQPVFDPVSPLWLTRTIAGRSGMTLYTYTARQGAISTSFSGNAPLTASGLEEARQKLLGLGVDLRIDDALPRATREG